MYELCVDEHKFQLTDRADLVRMLLHFQKIISVEGIDWMLAALPDSISMERHGHKFSIIAH